MTESTKLFRRKQQLVQATTMTLGVYHELRGWPAPKLADPAEEGYFTTFSDGKTAWFSKATFEAGWEVAADPAELTDAQIDAAIHAWFCGTPNTPPEECSQWRRDRMRAAIAAAGL